MLPFSGHTNGGITELDIAILYPRGLGHAHLAVAVVDMETLQAKTDHSGAFSLVKDYAK